MLLGRIAIDRVAAGGQLLLMIIAGICILGAVGSRRITGPADRERVTVQTPS